MTDWSELSDDELERRHAEFTAERERRTLAALTDAEIDRGLTELEAERWRRAEDEATFLRQRYPWQFDEATP